MGALKTSSEGGFLQTSVPGGVRSLKEEGKGNGGCGSASDGGLWYLNVIIKYRTEQKPEW